jgi:hypothetical protein
MIDFGFPLFDGVAALDFAWWLLGGFDWSVVTLFPFRSFFFETGAAQDVSTEVADTTGFWVEGSCEASVQRFRYYFMDPNEREKKRDSKGTDLLFGLGRLPEGGIWRFRDG